MALPSTSLRCKPGGLIVALALMLSPSCKEFSDYCDKKMSCEGGNDNDRAACRDSREASEDSASDYDCGSQFDDYENCIESNSTCTNGAYVAQSCSPQAQALSTCTKNASGRQK